MKTPMVYSSDDISHKGDTKSIWHTLANTELYLAKYEKHPECKVIWNGVTDFYSMFYFMFIERGLGSVGDRYM